MRQLFLPGGLLCAAGILLARFLPSSANSPLLFGTAAACTIAALVLAIRFHSLRATLAVIALAGAAAAQQWAASADAAWFAVVPAINLCLLLVVEEGNIEFQSVMWWSGLVILEWTGFVELFRYDAAVIHAAAHAGLLGLPWVWLVFGCACVLLLTRYFVSQEAIASGIFWACLALTGMAFGKVQALPLLAALVLIAVALMERSYFIAYHDELTKLPGRRAYNQMLASLDGDYCIAVVDVDHFKRFNDTFGHDVGDQVLRKVAAQLAEVQRPARAFRFGGEEFALVFPEMGLDESSQIADGLRQEIELDFFYVRGQDRSRREREERRTSRRKPRLARAQQTNVTVSIGVAQAAGKLTPQQVMEAADKALYAAKNAGRNRVELARPRAPRKAAKPQAASESV